MAIAQMIPVGSSAIKAIGYDSETKTLYIEFKKDRGYPTYQFSPVSAHTAGRMFKAGSMGAYYHRNIKTRGQYQVAASERNLEGTINYNKGMDIMWTAAKRYVAAGGP